MENIAISCPNYRSYLKKADLKISLPHELISVWAAHDALFRKMDYNKIEKLHEDQFQGLVELFDLWVHLELKTFSMMIWIAHRTQ